MQKSTQCQRILAELREGPLTTVDFFERLHIWKYSSRLADLRAKGYIIKATRIKKSLWSYHLEDWPTTEVVKELAGKFVPIPRQETLIDIPARMEFV